MQTTQNNFNSNPKCFYVIHPASKFVQRLTFKSPDHMKQSEPFKSLPIKATFELKTN